MKRKNKKPKFFLKFAILFLLVGISLSLSGDWSRVREAMVLATSNKPETFTELYFEDSDNLPETIEVKKKYDFSFTVHNLEEKETVYSYEVYIQTDFLKLTLDQGSFTLPDNGYMSIKEELGPLKEERMRIVVKLLNKNQQIDFLLKPEEE